MEINRGSDVYGGGIGSSSSMSNVSGNLTAPSGLEVESASFHMPTGSTSSSGVSASSGRDLKSKLSGLTSNLSRKVGDLKPMVSQRMTSMRDGLNTHVSTLRSTMNQRMMTMRDGVKMKASLMQSDMRMNPMKWAGIAAGTGFGLGLLTRLMDHRSHKHVRRGVPQLVIIDAC